MFSNWAIGHFAADVYGWSRDLWMTYHMYDWLDRMLSLPGDPPTMPLDF